MFDAVPGAFLIVPIYTIHTVYRLPNRAKYHMMARYFVN